MEKYNPENKEHASRAVINRCMAIECYEGRGTEGGNIHIDIRHVFDKVNEGPGKSIVGTMAKNGIDLRTDFLEVGSAPHTYLGGVRIDEWGRSTLDGLYAGGEAAGGIHGANRLGGLALIDSYVFGLRSGIAAALESKTREAPDPASGNWRDGIADLAERASRTGTGPSAEAWRREVQDLVVTSLDQVRSEETLTSGLTDLDRVGGEFDDVDNSGGTVRKRSESLRQTFETRNLIEVARMLGTAALMRRETRGGHFRIDYPERNDNNYLGNYVVWSDGGKCRAELRPVPGRDAVAPPPPGEHATSFNTLPQDEAAESAA